MFIDSECHFGSGEAQTQSTNDEAELQEQPGADDIDEEARGDPPYWVKMKVDTKRYKLWSCQTVCDALIYLLDNICIRFGTKLYRQIVGIPMGTNCAPLVADLFLFCYERDFLTSLSDVKQAEIIEAFKSTSRYLDDLLNIDNSYFEGMVNRIYPSELQLNKANTSNTEAPFLDLH